MNRPLSAALAMGALLLPLSLTACGTDTSEARPRSAGDERRKGADRSQLEARARAIGTSADMVYVIKVPGFVLAQQSVGVSGDDGFSGSYVFQGASRGKGGPVTVRAERGPRQDCPRTPARGGETCEREGELVFRTGDGEQRYELADGGHVITVSARPEEAERSLLREAARSVHRADDEELDRVLPPVRGRPMDMPPRGDLPSHGGGAPDNRPPEGSG
ncbi:hypothetical protein AF335_26045 [Streptomyces eurocidicus]|uniref:Membrane lipoprotein n=1 Tax=Streptomyces eurocidicus TaxID=66423 RepID=A0A2N8NPZ5_STREU|nr:hypothetical protein [Streptomyces eurocidicus]MBB5122401.1 hypothetical protein [Streptomyces eurocidicus]MBF6051685.1 hypothetical protein [Streptomyces eurocidicus]PNE30837.1 hypothetical protein AF335_26045 [Streptomyces eurocidicus]